MKQVTFAVVNGKEVITNTKAVRCVLPIHESLADSGEWLHAGQWADKKGFLSTTFIKFERA